MNTWLKIRLSTFHLKVRAGKTKDGRRINDSYWTAGWASGYKAAQRDARKAIREELGTVELK